MGSTPNLGLPYPELSDTADVPRDIRALADELDALLGGGGGGGGSGTLPLSNAPVLSVGMPGQVRAGRQLAVADFTSMGLSAPAGLFNLSGLTNLGSGGPLVNLGAVPFGVGINGLAATCAVFAGSTGQALYVVDTGAADPFRIRTGSWGCWFRTAKRGVDQRLVSKYQTVGQQTFDLRVGTGNVVEARVTTDGTNSIAVTGVSDVADDRWHYSVVTHDGSVLRLYVDGGLEALAATGFAGFAGSAPLNIGAAGADGSTAATSPCYGRVDEAFVTGDVLTEDEQRLLYATRLAHTLGVQPSGTRLSVHRRRKGAAWAVADFTTQPVRLHNFTGGAVTDQGSGGVALTPNPGTGAIIDVAGADGTLGNAKHLSGAHTGLSATDAGLPAGLTARSYGLWFKTASVSVGLLTWGGIATGGGVGQLRLGSNGTLATDSSIAGGAADTIASTGAVNDGQWHLAVAAEDNTAGDGVKRRLYLDGKLVAGSTVMNTLTLAGANRFRVGAFSDGTGPMVGSVDGAFVAGYTLGAADVAALWAKGAQELGASPKNAGDHVERLDATGVLFIADTLDPQHTVDLGVIA